MAETLFPVIQQPQLIKEQDIYDKQLRKSFSWDREKGDFILDGGGRVAESSGLEAYEIWCRKAVATARYSCLAYPSEIGTELERAMKKKTRKACETAIERTIKEALKVNPRTEYVRGFSFTWEGDHVKTSFTVKCIQNQEFQQTAVF